MKGYRAGDTVTLTVYRGGQYIEVELTFDTQPQTTGSDDSSQSSDNSYGYGNGGNSYGGGNRGVGQAKAVIFFVVVAAISIIQLQASRRKEVQQ